MSKISEQEYQNLCRLLYSNIPANDLLVLEIIRNLEHSELLIAPILILLANAETEETADFIYEFIEPLLLQEQKKYIGQRVYMLKGSHYTPFALFKYFNRSVCTDVAYINFKRTGENADAETFLYLDNGTHPDRSSAFQSYLAKDHSGNLRNTYQFFEIKFLLHDEMEIFLEKIFSSFSESFIPKLSIAHYKSKTLPEIIFSKKYNHVYVGGISHELPFPDYVFKFEGIKKLSIDVHKNLIIPRDWSALDQLEELKLWGHGYHFRDMRFIYTMPKLKVVDTDLNYMVDSNYWLKKIQNGEISDKSPDNKY